MLILDFDGTITDAETEGKPFRTGYLDDLAALTGCTRDEVDAMAARFDAQIARDPDRHGWLYDGHIVAPASVDPYLRIMPVARKIFDERGVFTDPADRTRLLDAVLYKYNYQKTATAFRPGARDLLLSLADADAYVVTNSHTEPVCDKIRKLARDHERARGDELDWLVARVRGRARKYVIDESFTAVEPSMRLAGLDRPVLLRRRAYHDVMRELLDQRGADWADLLVVGDIFELDLALPLALGARVGLVVNAFTPEYEKAFVAAHPRGHLVGSLADIAGLAMPSAGAPR